MEKPEIADIVTVSHTISHRSSRGPNYRLALFEKLGRSTRWPHCTTVGPTCHFLQPMSSLAPGGFVRKAFMPWIPLLRGYHCLLLYSFRLSPSSMMPDALKVWNRGIHRRGREVPRRIKLLRDFFPQVPDKRRDPDWGNV